MGIMSPKLGGQHSKSLKDISPKNIETNNHQLDPENFRQASEPAIQHWLKISG